MPTVLPSAMQMDALLCWVSADFIVHTLLCRQLITTCVFLAEEGKEESKAKEEAAAFWKLLGGKGKASPAATAGTDAQEDKKPAPLLFKYVPL